MAALIVNDSSQDLKHLHGAKAETNVMVRIMRFILLLSFSTLFSLGLTSCGGDDSPPPSPGDGGGMMLSCSEDGDCDDGNPCNGTETCVLNMCGGGATADDGTVCMIGDNAAICIGGFCMNSVCGDGYIDTTLSPPEECDDGNMAAFDGCEPDCQYTCEMDTDCDDGAPCNGAETCDVTSHNCRMGTNASNGSPCGEGLACRDGDCISVRCGDGVVDMGEDCDDGNIVDGDGCDDCVFSCTMAADCDDGSVCTGMEDCDIATHTCQDGTPLSCTPTDACHRLSEPACDPADGCQEELIDDDSDGFVPMDLTCTDPSIQGDCNDGRDDIYPMAPELCDGDDNDCDGMIDEGNPVWYPDCDKDGYAPSGSSGTVACSPPDGRPPGCSLAPSGIQWTTRVPTGRSESDCNDNRDDVNPTITVYSSSPHSGTDYDWNCNGSEERQYTSTGGDTEGRCGPSGFIFCTGSSGWVGRSAPSCGASATFTSCGLSVGVRCSRSTRTLAQSCR